MSEPLKLFLDEAKNLAVRQRLACLSCGSAQMQLLNGHESVEAWVWRCRMCRVERS